MDFIHKPFVKGETIAAIATPPGEGGIAIIRISGDRALEIVDPLFSGAVQSYKSHTAHFGTICDLGGNRIDEGLCLVMRNPCSYTGEDTVELQCHGGTIASRKILGAILEAGARAAAAGEFTFKAFMNGKLDLAQAEAVQQLIGAKNEQAYQAANAHLEGALSGQIEAFQQELIRLGAILEAWVDFPEEGIAFTSMEQMLIDLKAVQTQIAQLLATFQDGKKLEQGISLCIVGPPNAGKSSLMNALLRSERAIVTPIAGTTRDILQEELTLGGLHFNLLDTAGIRETTQVIEQEGIRRSKKAMNAADLVLLVLDVTQKPDQDLLNTVPADKTLLAWNKSDLQDVKPEVTLPHQVLISAKKHLGLDKLKAKIDALVWQNGVPSKDQVMISTVRHKEALSEACIALSKVIKGLEGEISPEFVTADLREVLKALGRMIGTNISEDILSSIFSQFCVGK